MRAYLNLDTGLLTATSAGTAALTRLSAKRGDLFELEVVPSATLARGATGIFAAKPKAAYGTSATLLYGTWAPPQASGSGWLFAFPLDTAELNALFSAPTTTEVTLMAEITWTASGKTRSTPTLDFTIARDIWRGDEATPDPALPDLRATAAEAEAGTDNSKWMTPLRTAEAIAALAPPPTWEAVADKPETYPPDSHAHSSDDIVEGENLFFTPERAVAACLASSASVAFTSSGQAHVCPESRNQSVYVTMGFTNGQATVSLPTTARAGDICTVDANVAANCTLTVGPLVLANTNQYYGIGRRLLKFVHNGTTWNLYEHPYHTHTSDQIAFATAPQTPTTPGKQGTISYAGDYLYVCVANNSWRRTLLATW